VRSTPNDGGKGFPSLAHNIKNGFFIGRFCFMQKLKNKIDNESVGFFIALALIILSIIFGNGWGAY